MKDILNIAIIQSDLAWEDVDQNLNMFSHKINQIKSADLIILPEMFTTGFTMKSHTLAEEMNGKTLQWMKQKADEKKCMIMGSIIIKDSGQYYNRLISMPSNGNFQFYDKRHLFRMGEEHTFYKPGKNKIIATINNWKICPLICYDLRFPVWSRNRSDYDLLIYIANWPEARKEVWKSLLTARAIENQTYVIGVNRIGRDGMKISYSGDSVAINAKGEIISKIKPYEDAIETVFISLNELNDFRKKFPVSNDADNFKILLD